MKTSDVRAGSDPAKNEGKWSKKEKQREKEETHEVQKSWSAAAFRPHDPDAGAGASACDSVGGRK